MLATRCGESITYSGFCVEKSEAFRHVSWNTICALCHHKYQVTEHDIAVSCSVCIDLSSEKTDLSFHLQQSFICTTFGNFAIQKIDPIGSYRRSLTMM